MPNPIVEYFRTAKEELEKVSWPSKEDTLRYGTLIIVGSVLAAVFFGAIDLGLERLVQATIGARGQTAASAPVAPEEPTTQPIEVTPGSIEATDQNGNKVNLDAKTIPVNPSTPPATK